MLDIVCRSVDDARQQYLVGREFDLLPYGPFMFVPRIGSFERQSFRIYAEDDAQYFFEADIVCVRTLVVAPADMNANHIHGNIGHRVVEGLDMKFSALEKFEL